MEDLTKDQNDLLICNDTYIQFLNTQLSAINRLVCDRQKCFYSTRMFLLCSVRRVIEIYKYQNTSGINYEEQWATYWTGLTQISF